jgi:hypothetical protein
VLFGLEGLVEAVAQAPRQVGEIWVLQRIYQRRLPMDSSDVSGDRC